jgi:hypothetical protein
MKAHPLFFFLLLLVSNELFAQSSSTTQKEDIEAQRVGFITKELQLTAQEAEEFWPIYNKYRKELIPFRKGRSGMLMANKVNFDTMSDEELSKVIDNEFDFRQKELDLTRRYNAEFKKVLTIKKVAKLYRAEQLFKIYLLKGNRLEKLDNPDPAN